ncbi:MAG: hypothetical protein ACK2UW_05555 [Anaerolineales bacterium]
MNNPLPAAALAGTTLAGIRLQAARAGWWLICLLSISLFTLAVPLRYAQLLSDPYGFGPYLQQMGLSIRFFAAYGTGMDVLVALICYTTAIFTFLQRSDDWVILLVTQTIILITVGVLPVVEILPEAYPALQPVLIGLRILGLNSLTIMFFVFPNGQFYPRWTRWVALGIFIYTLSWLFLPATLPPASIPEFAASRNYLLLIGVFSWMLLGILTQILRYRHHATPVQRQQTKVVIYAFLLAGLLLLLLGVIIIFFPIVRAPGIWNVVYTLLGISLILAALVSIPIGIALAVLRYHLWDVDLIIRRTLVYSSVTLLLGAIYFSGVTIIQSVFTSLTGEQSTIAIVLSTLAIAALFNPLRTRVQDFIDRRFYRQRYHAQQEIERFAAAVQQETELNQILHHLASVLGETIQPSQINFEIDNSTKNRRNE